MSEGSSGPGTARPPGRPRSPQADQAIIGATLELLVEAGYRALSMEQVRARAGVGKATIYRRYTGKDDLVKAAIAHLHQDLPVPEDTGSLVGDYAALSEAAAEAAMATRATTVIPRLLAEAAGDDDLHALVYENLIVPRRTRLRAVLERAVGRGEIRADADLEIAIDLILGSLVYRTLIGHDIETLTERAAVSFAHILTGLQPR